MRLKDRGTIVQLLRRRAEDQPNHPAFVFLKGGEVESGRLTYGELDARARAVADNLGQTKMLGKCALLLYPSGLEFIEAFFGCLYAGVVAVPCYPPRRNRSDHRVAAIVKDTQATLALTTSEVLRQADLRTAQQPEMKAMGWLATDQLVASPMPSTRLPSITSDALAYLQYTSGSTSIPKGVMISHATLFNTLADLDLGWKHDASSVMVTWLPLFHDMGLIYGVLQPLYNGFPCYLMDPASFLQSPVRWLQAISVYQATHSAAPNFAFDLCQRSITEEQKATLNLSSWQVVLNAAEPVREATLRAFSTAFGPCGFGSRTFCPGYGLAESTLKVTAVRRGAERKVLRVRAGALSLGLVQDAADGEADVRTLVGCGQSEVGTRIVIVDPQTLTECRPEQVGEIWVSGRSVAHGYWMRPEETEETFGAHLSDTGDGPFLRTGDLGFLRDDELFITGRLKDMIIIRGLNYYPQDIELTVERSHPALRPGCGAAFALDADNEERLAVAHELERNHLRGADVNEVISAIREAVAREHELTVHTVLLLRPASIPKTSSGKIQRRACRSAFLAGELTLVGQWQQRAVGEMNTEPEGRTKEYANLEADALQQWLIERLARHLKVSPSEIDARQPFARYGVDSMTTVRLSGELAEWLNRKLSPTVFFDYPTPEALARYLAVDASADQTATSAIANRGVSAVPVAVIGVGCRFPGAPDVDSFWRLLCAGLDTAKPLPLSRDFHDPVPTASGKRSAHYGHFLDAVECFDADFFGISPREAENMDPQQRLLLEVAWEALESGGQANSAGSETGVFVGISNSDYSRLLVNRADANAYYGTGTALSIAANRLSYQLDLRGPSWAVDTACSSSLVAVHNACQSLQQHECNLALAGGVNLVLTPDLNIAFSQAGMLTGDGRCKTFDADADGYARGEGCGVVVLKRYSDALRDGDNVMAVILGSAVNQDGRSNGLTAPNGLAQQQVICRALENAGVFPAEISYVETHGTGTPLGDPIEINALKAVLLDGRSQDQPCWFGSVKTNIGHLEAAAGIAGLIKVVLALQQGELPPHLHLKKLNPHIQLDGTPLSVLTRRQSWPHTERRRVAGVSSFGFGGTNAHVVVRDAPPITAAVDNVSTRRQILVLSAKSEPALQELAGAYESHLATHSEQRLADICFSANIGRSHFRHRLAVTADSIEQLRAKLSTADAGREKSDLFSGEAPVSSRLRVVFLFSGQGCQYPDMGRELYETVPPFRRSLDECDSILRPLLDTPLLEAMYGSAADDSLLDQTAYTQPALFALEYSLAQLWQAWGIQPSAVMGHSVGEYVAACVAGVFSLEDALKLIAIRGRLMHALPGKGEMVAVLADEAKVAQTIERHSLEISIAAINGPRNTVISGGCYAIKTAVEAFEADQVTTNPLNTAHAFHSTLMEPMLAEFQRAAEAVNYYVPSIKLISNLTGQSIDEEIANADYWCRHVRQPVRFAKGMDALARQGYEVYVELGPQPVLVSMGRQCLANVPLAAWLPSLRRGRSDWQQMLDSLAQLYIRGAAVDWGRFYQGVDPRRVPLPTYPFQRQRYWIAKKGARKRLADATPQDLFYELKWQPAPRRSDDSGKPIQFEQPGCWLILADQGGVGAALAQQLAACGQTCRLIYAGACSDLVDGRSWSVDPADQDELSLTCRAALDTAQLPLQGVVHLWGLDAASADDLNETSLQPFQRLSCVSVIHLVQTLTKQGLFARLWIATRGAVPAEASGCVRNVAQALLWGLGKVVALEHPELWGGIVDLAPEPTADEAAWLLAELYDAEGEDQLAFRNGQRLVARLVRETLDERQGAEFHAEASYLITGGLGALGLKVAKWMVRRGARQLVLVGRRKPSDHALETLAELKAAGARVVCVQADVSKQQDVAELLEEIAATMPPLRGVIHAAGAGDLRLIKDIDPLTLEITLRPKVAGAWNLHQLTRDLDLDHFICFSSIASVWGSKGQAHYAAANHFLDGLAHYRRGLGLPALTVNWGPWAGGGMASDEYRKQLQRIGVRELAAESAVNALGFLLAAAAPQLTVADIDWRAFKEVYEARSRRRLLDEIEVPAADEEKHQTSQAPSLLKQLEGSIAPDRRRLLVEHLQKEVASVLGFGDDRQLDVHQGFFEMGMDSLMAVDLKNRLSKALGASLPATLIFDFPNIEDLAGFLLRHLGMEQTATARFIRRVTQVIEAEPIAIVALGCRFPGGVIDAQSFWQLLHAGTDAIGKVPADRWDGDAYFDENRELCGTMYTQAGGFLDRVDGFDAHFFGISPREALSMDPQQRLLLEVGYEALENAPLGSSRSAAERTGVFVGITNNDYAQLLLRGGYDQIDPYFVTGNSLNAAAGRLSYILGLQGPSMTVDTACSSSLVAVHLACQSLANGECDQALAGGVNLILSPATFIATCQSQMLSPDGRCKTFDASANGYGRGEGCGVVVLKRLSDALAAGNQVLALIRGSAVNQDGASGGFTVPNGQSQQQLLREALARAGVEPREVSYVEAHGTGTSLGDPIEMGALSAVLCEGRSAERPLVVGSVKTNIGHLESAAGIAGLIKTVLALQHGEIPSHRHFRDPNPHIPWDEIPVVVPTENRPWESEDGKRIAGVSAFGFSGTNAHVVLESAPQGVSAASAVERPLHVLTLSAKTEDALAELAERYVDYLQEHPTTPLADICFTANQRRSYNHRLALIASSVEQVREQLSSFGKGDPTAGLLRGETAGGDSPRVAFLFTGQGSQYAGMGRELYQTQPTFRQTFDECAAILRPYLKTPLLEVLFSDANDSLLDQTAYAQPALFALEYSLAELWKSWGIQPSAVMGHSVGEYVAACVGGVFSLEDGLKLIAHRGQLMQALSGEGEMVAVLAEEAKVAKAITDNALDVSIAALNGLRNTVISGNRREMERAVAVLEASGVATKKLNTSHAFHSQMMVPMLPAFKQAASAVAFSAPSIDLISNLTGEVTNEQTMTPEYWCRHLREPVRFAAGMQALDRLGCEAYVELGPQPVLLGMGRQCLSGDAAVWLPSLRRNRPDWQQLLESLAALHVHNIPVNWVGFNRDYSYHHVPLPTYPFQAERFWAVQDKRPLRRAARDWFYRIRWQPSPRRMDGAADTSTLEAPGCWLILADQGGVGAALAQQLAACGQACRLIYAGACSDLVDGRSWSVDPADQDELSLTCRAALDTAQLPLQGVVHLWGLDAASADDLNETSLQPFQRLSCVSVIHLVQTLTKQGLFARLWIATRGAVPAEASGCVRNVAQALLWGLGKVVALEHPELWGGIVDLAPEPTADEAAWLLAELYDAEGEDQLAFRNGQRLVARLVRETLDERQGAEFHAEASYLITGGLGALGLKVAKWMVRRGARQLVLVGRRKPSDHALETLAELKAAGARVVCVQADVSKQQDVAELLEEIAATMPPLRGVIHAAGAGDLRLIKDIDPLTLEITLRPKVAGAWNLHQLTRDLDLDHFICFSSIASVWGSKGQAHYAAANHFLDGLAHYRRGLGLPALTVNWGPWAGGGMASDEYRKQLQRIGVRELAAESAVNALGFLLAAAAPQLTVADIDWRAFKEVYEARSRRRLLDEIEVPAADEEKHQTSQAPSLLKQLEGSIAPDRRRLLVEHLQKEVASVLGFGDDRQLDVHQGFFEMGMDSLMAVDLKNRLSKALGASLPATLIFDFPNIEDLAGFLLRHLGMEQTATARFIRRVTQVIEAEPIAIVALGCRFPGGVIDAQSFWQLLHAGTDAIGKVPADRWDGDAYFDENRELCGTMYTQAGGFLDRVDGFDAHFFGISPREALSMDPQQRLLLEVGYEALENAPLGSSRSAAERTGVFVGITNNDYAQLLLRGGYDQIDPYFVTGNSLNAAAGRLSYILGLQGPSMTVDTACSSSLVAVHLACQSLANGECDQALAGGVNLILSPATFIATCQSQMLSPDGRCKTFDASANGYGRGEGCGVVVLKRLSDALAAGNQVLALIRGSAVNQDGASGGFTVPNGQSQQQLLREALARAGVEPREVSYVEAHGTGTSLGDPIEMGALSAVLCEGRSAERPLVVGSVKTNIGHLESAAGIAGLIKTVLALQHGEIPSHRHFRDPNPHIPWDEIPVVVPTENRPWESEDGKRIAGVSAFGFSGTNAHVVLESAPQGVSAASAVERPLHVLTLSAKTEDALAELAERYVDYLQEHPTTPLADICFTANQRRSYNHRLALIASSVEQVREQLSSFGKGDPTAGLLRGETAGGDSPRVAFLFTGQGSQYAGMGRELYQTQPTFRQTFDECAAILRPYLKTPLLEVLHPPSNGKTRAKGSESLRLADNHHSDLALFALEYALAELWQSWGIHASFVMGYGVGEYAAACFAGVFALEQAFKLVVEQTQEMRSLRPITEAFNITDGKLNSPVRFVANLDELLQQNCQAYIEIGPHPVQLEKGCPGPPANGAHWLAGLFKEQSDWQTLLQSLAALYTLGARIDWTAFDREYTRCGVTLPVHPFRRQSYWPAAIGNAKHRPQGAPRATASTAAHPLLGQRRYSAVSRSEIEFESWINEQHPAFLNDHRVFGKTIVPSSVYLEMALVAARDVIGSPTSNITDVEILRALTVTPGDDRQLQFVLSPLGSDRYGFQAFSLNKEDAPRDPAWTLHAKGQIHSMAKGQVAVPPLATLRSRFSEEVPVADFYEQCRRREIQLGPMFQALQQLWRGESEALGYVRLPEAFVPDAAAYQFHPALLDACFQTLGGALPDSGGETTYLQVAIEEFKLFAQPGFGLWSYVRVHDAGEAHPELLKADFLLFADDGTAVAEIEGVRLQKATREATLGEVPDVLASDLYEIDWVRQNQTGRSAKLVRPERIRSRVLLQLAETLATDELTEFGEAMAAFEAVATDIVLHGLREMGWQLEPDERFSLASAVERLGVVHRYMRLLERLFEILAEDGIVQRVADSWQVVRQPVVKDPRAELQRLMDQYPAARAELVLLHSCGSSLAATVRGECDPMQLLLPQGDLSTLSRLYQDSVSAATMNSLMARSVGAALEEWPDDRRLRVLEIGAGTGGTTSHILPQLPGTQTEYTFTDVSDIFTSFAKEKFQRFGFLRYATLDIEHDPLSQGFAANEYDLVIAANVLHATSDLGRTLAHVKGLLAPGGALIMLEGTAPLRFLDLTFGLTEGWWKFSDHGLRPSYPLISADAWKAVLVDSGFEGVATVSAVEESHGALPPQAVIVANVPRYNHAPQASESGSWLMLADRGGVGRQLGSLLRARGERCTLVFAGSADQQLAEDEFVIPAGDAQAYRRMLDPFVDDQPPLRGVIHLWCLDANGSLSSEEGDLSAALEISCRSALYLTQALVSCGWRSAPALWLGTRGAVSIDVGQSVERASDVRRLAESSLWGLGRVISQEHPELRCSLLDLDVTADERDPHRLLDEIYHRGPTVEDQIAYRTGYRHLARLKRSRATVRAQTSAVHPDGTYLITGGRGEIGLLVARWLADQGARNLVLVGRTIGSPKARQAMSDLERTGVRIVAARADVSRMQAVADVLEDIKLRMPPLAGVVHAAGVLEDRLIVDHQWDLFEKVFAPKVHGAWNLHVLTREMPLDFFVLFSSASTVVGGSGLGNYVAANQFLDALAAHRRAVGLPGLSLDWGPWAGVGMANVVGRVREGQWSEMGLNPLSPARALEMLRHALQLDAARVSVMSMDWTKFQQRCSSQPISRFFEHVLPTSQPDPRQHSAFRQQIESAVAANRRPLLMAYVRAQVEETLGWGGGEHVQVKQGFFDIGMDSLRAVELRNRLQSGLACTLPATLTIKYPTIESLVEYLLKEVLSFEPPRDQGSGNSRDSVPPNVLAPVVSEEVLDSSITDELERLEELLRGT